MDTSKTEIMRAKSSVSDDLFQLVEFGIDFNVLRDGKVIHTIIESENRWIIEGDTAHQFFTPERAFEFIVENA